MGRKTHMKANRKFVLGDEAVSPVIAVILMVAITVVLAATVFVLVNGISSKGKTPPSVNFDPTSDNAANDVIVKFTSGEKLTAGDWKISVTNGSTSSPVYATGDPAWEAGQQITFNRTTVAATSIVAAQLSGTKYEGGTTYILGGYTYHVVIFHIKSDSTVLDRTVEVT